MKSHVLHVLYTAALVLLITSCTENPSDNVSEDKTREVLEHHWEAFKGNDLEAVMADYTEESVLITPDTTYRGLIEIRENFMLAFEAFPKNQSTLKLNKTVVEKDLAYILWEAKTPIFELTLGSDTFIIKNGKIVFQTYAGVRNPN